MALSLTLRRQILNSLFIKFVVHDRIDHIHIHFLLIVDLRSPTNTDSWAVSAPSHVVHYEVSFTSLHSKIQFGYTSFSLTANVCDNTATTKLASHRNMRAVHVQKSELSWLSANSTRHPPNWPAVDLGLDAICLLSLLVLLSARRGPFSRVFGRLFSFPKPTFTKGKWRYKNDL